MNYVKLLRPMHVGRTGDLVSWLLRKDPNGLHGILDSRTIRPIAHALNNAGLMYLAIFQAAVIRGQAKKGGAT